MPDTPGQQAPGTAAGQVAVVGSVNIDHIVHTSTFPVPGETILGRSQATSLGGKGANQAAAAVRCGTSAQLIARVGDDPDGALAVSTLAGLGVDVSAVTTAQDAGTGSAWITVCGEDNTIIVVPAANSHWPAGDLPDAVAAADVVLAQLEIPLAIVERAAALSTHYFILNAAPALALPKAVIARCDLLVVNQHELATLTGRPPAQPSDDYAAVVKAQHRLLDQGASAVVVTLGPDGAILCTPGQALHQPAPPAAVVDTTGAGDAFCGALAAALAAGHPLATAVGWGVAAGSLTVGSPAAMAAFSRTQLQQAIDTLPSAATL